FWEGDGGVYRTTLHFVQKDRRILEHIRSLLRVDSAICSDNGGMRPSITGYGRLRALFDLLGALVVIPGRVEQLRQLGVAVGSNEFVRSHEPTRHWFTGFWDAEGSSSVSQVDVTPVLAVQVSQKNRKVLEQCIELWGGGCICKGAGRDCSTLNFTGPLCWTVGEWLLETSRNTDKRGALHERMYSLQEYNRTRKGR
ncbi:hypothetical protein LCGC14_2269070, partial [marine sediment metagenome]